MKRMQLILRRDFNEMRATTAFRIMLSIAILITAAASLAISLALRLQTWFGAAEAIPVLDLITGLVVYFIPLILLLSFIWAFATMPVIKEKLNGNLECLLATPLSPRSLWAGKVLAVFLPGFIISLTASAFVLLVLHLAVFLPGWGVISLPAPGLVNGLVITPLLFLGLAAFIMLFSFINNPDIALAPSLLIGFGLMIGLPVGLMTGFIDINSWSFTLWYLAGSIVIWLVVILLSRSLNGQNVVLSSKGG